MVWLFSSFYYISICLYIPSKIYKLIRYFMSGEKADKMVNLSLDIFHQRSKQKSIWSNSEDFTIRLLNTSN